jgi:hypothetical protein
MPFFIAIILGENFILSFLKNKNGSMSVCLGLNIIPISIRYEQVPSIHNNIYLFNARGIHTLNTSKRAIRGKT